MKLFNATPVNEVPKQQPVSRRQLPPTNIAMQAYPSINIEQFAESDREVAALIYRRRLQLLVHSCLYYHLDCNLISDATFDAWGKELAMLQQQYPNVSQRLCYSNVFRNWSGGTGAFLPYKDDWVLQKALQLIREEKLYGTTKF